jgi:RNA polymerase sigma-70 factor (ECF subfamily)
MSQPAAPDEALVARIQAGESSLYGVLVERYQESLHRVVASMLRGDSESDDVLQEAHLRAFTRLAQFRGESRFSTWLHRIVVNQALQYRRSTWRVQYMRQGCIPESRTGEDPPLSRMLSPEHHTAAGEIRAALASAMDALPPSHRCVFEMKEIEHLTTREIGSRLGITEACAKTRLHRAKAQLRESLRDFVRTSPGPRRHWQPLSSLSPIATEAA